MEIVIGEEHISFTTSKIGSFFDVDKSSDPAGLGLFYYLVQDLKCFVFSIISLHFRVNYFLIEFIFIIDKTCTSIRGFENYYSYIYLMLKKC